MSAENTVAKICPVCGQNPRYRSTKNQLSKFCSLPCRLKAKAIRRSEKARLNRQPRTCRLCSSAPVWSDNPMCLYCKPCADSLADKRAVAYRDSHRESAAERSREWRQADPDRYRETQRKQRQKDLEAYNASKRRYYWSRVDVERARQKIKNQREREREVEKDRKRQWSKLNPQYIKAWRRNNSAKLREYWIRREYLLDTSALTDEQVAQILELRTSAKALGLTIDHIVPLRSCRMCGASGKHVPENIQLMTFAENSRKSNHCQTCWEIKQQQQ